MVFGAASCGGSTWVADGAHAVLPQDLDSNGTLDRDELRKALTNAGKRLTEAQRKLVG